MHEKQEFSSKKKHVWVNVREDVMGTGEHAVQLLGRQGIMKGEICSAICSAFAKGRGKYQIVCIHGLTNRGKSFILSRVRVIYKRMLRLFISMISDCSESSYVVRAMYDT